MTKRNLTILAVESSCDDTAVAIVKNGRQVLADLVMRQTEIHKKFGGIVPEVASREHLSFIFPLIKEALTKAKLTPKEIDLLAVTAGPGLRGSLLVGVKTIETLSYLWRKKVVPVNHLQAHLFAGLLNSGAAWQFPVLALVVSGGHTDLVLVKNYLNYKILGETRDDAAGEAFDKIAKLLNLPYPGGPAIERAAAKVKKEVQAFLPRPMIGSSDFDFSFAGLKTAVKAALSKKSRAEIAVDAQNAIVEVLSSKLLRAYRRFKPKMVLLGGGVSANKLLRRSVQKLLGGKVSVIIPEFKYSVDNAAMVAAAAYFLKERACQWYNLSVESDLSFAKVL
jgi:N6-L-threonylcarbamoyladenine synthase